MNHSNPDEIRDAVRVNYARIARGETTGCCGPSGGCCGAPDAASPSLAASLGYDPAQLGTLPDGADLGLSCGNPTALAELRPGEIVLDLGSGGGLDVFLAGQRVGPAGRAIGVDMTPDMIARARRAAADYRARTGLDNVEFRLGEIEHLPVADASVDVVISNCVINLSPDKPQVWREIARVLKPGGRVAVSDLALKRPLPPALTRSVEALVGCIAGAVAIGETERMAREAGLVDIELTLHDEAVDAMTDWNDPFYRSVLAALPPGERPRDYVTSLAVRARKPTAAP